MNDLSLIIYSLKSRLMNSILSVLLTAFGVSIALLILQFENHVNDRITFDGKGIDIVSYRCAGGNFIVGSSMLLPPLM